MPIFTYRAKKGPQEIITDTIDAASVNEAVNKLMQAGYVPLEVKEQLVKVSSKPAATKSNAGTPVLKAGVPLKVVGNFTRGMYDLLDAGVPLMRSLQTMAGQKLHPALKPIIEQMLLYVKDGGSLSGALAAHPQVFSKLYVNMVKSGEASGNLAQILDRLAQFIDKELELRAQVSGAMLYPLIILGVGILTIVVMLTFVLPRLMTMFEDFDSALPGPTVLVIGLSNFFAQFWWLVLIVSVGAAYGAKQFYDSPKGRHQVDAFLLQIPLIGQFIREAQMARFARTLGTLLESGVAIPQALESTALVIDNVVLQEQMQEVAVKVRAGSSLTAAIKSVDVFGEIALNFISVGEESGKLERGLYKLAITCDRQTKETAGNFVTVLGPLMLVFIVGIVGFMVVAMLLPIFKMNTVIN